MKDYNSTPASQMQVSFITHISFYFSVQHSPVQHGDHVQRGGCLQRRWEVPFVGSRYETEGTGQPAIK